MANRLILVSLTGPWYHKPRRRRGHKPSCQYMQSEHAWRYIYLLVHLPFYFYGIVPGANLHSCSVLPLGFQLCRDAMFFAIKAIIVCWVCLFPRAN